MEDISGNAITIKNLLYLLILMPDWDDIFTDNGRVFEEPHPDMERISRFFKEKGVKRVLDLGCGTGRHLIYLSKKGFEVYGMDGSPKALEIAEKWLIEESQKAELQLHRMELQFPYKEDFFDAIISIQVIHHNLMEDIIYTVSEIERILKSNGIIYITFPRLGGGSNIDNWKLKEIEEGTYIPQAGREKGLPHHFFTLEEINDVFNSFKLLEIYDDGTNHRAILGIKK
ncbi:MAG: class I SAM-dependent methyltransferase [Promethearchaeota archaeon]